MRTMVLSTWWALMKRRIGDAMSAGVRERSRASEWVLEREPSAFSLGCLSTCNGCDVYSKSVRSVSTSRCIYLLRKSLMSKSGFKLHPKNRKPTVGRAIFPLEAQPAPLAPARPRPHTGTATHASGPPRTRESPEKRERAHTGNGHTSAHTRGPSPSITGARVSIRRSGSTEVPCRF